MTTPWAEMLRLAAVRFHIPPATFWRLSLTEWRALTEPERGEILTREALDALAKAYPD